MASTAELVVLIKARDEASRVVKGFTKNLTGLQKVALGIGGAAAVSLAAIGVASIKMAADFEAAMSQSLAIMGDVSEALRGDMSDAAREVAKTTTFSAKQAAESYFFLASAGLDAKASIEALPAVASFAQAGMFDMALATDLLTDAQSALGLTIKNDAVANMKNMIAVSDILVGANTLANASVQQFSQALTQKAAAAMRAANVEVTEGVAVLAAFADQGIKGSEAGTQFAIVLRDLQTKAIQNKKAFAEFGLEVFDAQGNLNNLGGIIGDLESGLEGLSAEQIKATLLMLGFSDKSIGALQALIGTSDAIAGYEASLRSMAGITEEVAEKQLQNFNAQLSLLKSTLEDLMITLGTRVLPALTESVRFAIDALRGFSQSADEAGVAAVGAKVQLLELTKTFLESVRVIGIVSGLIVGVFNPAMGVALVAASIAANQALGGVRNELEETRRELNLLVTDEAQRELRELADQATGTTRQLHLLVQVNDVLAAQTAAFKPISPLIADIEALDAQIARLAGAGRLGTQLDNLIADRARIIRQIEAFGATASGAGVEARPSAGGTGPAAGVGVGAGLGSVIADNFREALTAADLPGVAADELIRILDFLQAVADNRMPTLLDQLNFVQAMADNAAKARAELEAEVSRLDDLFKQGTPLFEIFDMFTKSDFGAQKVAEAIEALLPLEAKVRDLTDELRLFADAFDLPLDAVREITREFGFIPPEVDLIGQALSALEIPVPEAFELFNAFAEARDVLEESARLLREMEETTNRMAGLARATFAVLPGNISQEDLQNILDLLNPNLPGPFTDIPPPEPPPTGLAAIPRTLAAGTPVQNITQNITIKSDSPSEIAHMFEMASIEAGRQLAAEGV